jgi:hypothetical protein
MSMKLSHSRGWGDPTRICESAAVRLLDRYRFPPPWSVEETAACFVVRDSAGRAVAHLYYEGEADARSAANLLTKNEARRRAVNVAKLPELLRRVA